MTAKLDLKELRKVAESATPGPWETLGGQGPFGTHAVCHRMEQGTLVEIAYRDAHFDKANAVHIAAFDPPTVLRLLDLAESEAEHAELNPKLAEILRATANALKGEPEPLVSHSWHDLAEVAAELKNRAEQAEQQVARVRAIHSPHDALMNPGRYERRVKVCTGCGTDDGNWQVYPCPTIRALDGEANE